MIEFLSTSVFSQAKPTSSDILFGFLLTIAILMILFSNYIRRNARTHFERQLHYQKILWDLAKKDFLEQEPAFQEICRTIAETLEVDRVSIWRHTPDRQAILCEDMYVKQEKSHQKGAAIHLQNPSDFLQRLVIEQTLVVDDTSRDERIRNLNDPHFSNHTISAVLITLIWREGMPDGILCFSCLKKTHQWSSEEINLAVGAAELITLILESADRRQAEKALAVEAELLRSLMNSSADSIYFKDRDSRYLRINRGFYQMLEIDPSVDVVGKTDFDFYSETIARASIEQEKNVMDQGQALENHTENQSGKENARRWISTTKVPIHNVDGEVIGLVGISRDITTLKIQELKMRQFLQAIEQSPATVVITDLNGDIQYANPKFSRITGYTLEEAVGKNPRFLKSGETPPEEYARMWKIISSGGEWSGEFHNRKKDGGLYWERAFISGVTDIDNQIVGYIAIKEDITDEKIMQEALTAAQKLATIGNLAAGIAHEINNPMQTVIGMSDSLLSKINEDENDPGMTKKYLETIRRNGWRVAEIVRSLLTYSRAPENSFSAADLNEIIRDALLLIEHQLLSWSNINVLTELNPNIPPINCDREKITQVLINLLTNAKDAMVGGGQVTISTQTDALGNSINLVVKDTGKGIPQSVMEKIFDPFFTTKPIGEGTGLGLSIVHGIVHSHQGKINVMSQINRGSTFTITFPRYCPVEETREIVS